MTSGSKCRADSERLERSTRAVPTQRLSRPGLAPQSGGTSSPDSRSSRPVGFASGAPRRPRVEDLDPQGPSPGDLARQVAGGPRAATSAATANSGGCRTCRVGQGARCPGRRKPQRFPRESGFRKRQVIWPMGDSAATRFGRPSWSWAA